MNQRVTLVMPGTIDTGTVIVLSRFYTIVKTIEHTYYRGHGAQEGQEGQEAGL